MNNFLARFLLVALAASVLGGCAAIPHEPAPFPEPKLQQPPPRRDNGAIFQTGRDVRLFEDRTGHRVGDIITVELQESTDASKQADTTISKSDSVDMATPQIFGRDMSVGGNPLSASAKADRSFGGKGTSDQKNALTGTITAIVVAVEGNGNLVIRGRKKITINSGDEFVTISGIVRPDDVSSDNTVSSTRVANAQISYTGNGQLADSNKMGWLARFFNSVIWPF